MTRYDLDLACPRCPCVVQCLTDATGQPPLSSSPYTLHPTRWPTPSRSLPLSVRPANETKPTNERSRPVGMTTGDTAATTRSRPHSSLLFARRPKSLPPFTARCTWHELSPDAPQLITIEPLIGRSARVAVTLLLLLLDEFLERRRTGRPESLQTQNQNLIPLI